MSTSRFILGLATSSLVAAVVAFSGCSTDPGNASQSTASAIGVPNPPISMAPSCSAAGTATGDTTLDLLVHMVGTSCTGACPTDARAMITAHLDLNPTTQVSTVTWRASDPANGMAYAASVTVNGSTTTSQITYGNILSGVTQGSFVDNGVTLTGSIDGRTIKPVTLSTFHATDSLTFTDGKPAPTIVPNTSAMTELTKLTKVARTTGLEACEPAATLEISRLSSAFPGSSTGADGPPLPTTPAPAPSVTAKGPGVAQGTPANGGVAIGTSLYEGTGATSQNTPDDWETPGCQQCQSDCATDILSWLTLGAGEALCMVDCFIPGHGCTEEVCGVGTSCDSNQSCCGSICCGSDATCGNDKLGDCCPKDNPVACGDSTGAWCFPQGTSCCGDLLFGCDPGYVCTNVTGTTASCCPAGQVDKAGQCCSTGILCDGACCPGGSTCSNGQCCFGPTDSKGECCGFDGTVVNGACCAAGQACGSACCGTGLACLNAATSQCGAPPPPATCATGKVTCMDGDTAYCCFPDEHCNGSVPQCCGGAETGSPGCIIK
jgi:hypothetical protein